MSVIERLSGLIPGSAPGQQPIPWNDPMHVAFLWAASNIRMFQRMNRLAQTARGASPTIAKLRSLR